MLGYNRFNFIREDAGGYGGSLDWTRFCSVIYQTSAFESEDRIRLELTRRSERDAL